MIIHWHGHAMFILCQIGTPHESWQCLYFAPFCSCWSCESIKGLAGQTLRPRGPDMARGPYVGHPCKIYDITYSLNFTSIDFLWIRSMLNLKLWVYYYVFLLTLYWHLHWEGSEGRGCRCRFFVHFLFFNLLDKKQDSRVGVRPITLMW